MDAHLILDRRDLPVSSAELHTRLAHALVQYLGLTSPQDLSEFNIHSAGDLLDLTSRVSAKGANFYIHHLSICSSPPIVLL